MKDIKTQSIVLKRTNYGEADRILQLLTPDGKISVIARGVRKERSRLAGAVELFSLTEVNIHQGKGELGILTGARLMEFYGRIMGDLAALELAGNCLREVSRRAEQVDNPEFFALLAQTLKQLNAHLERTELIRIWWQLNLLRASGEDVNLHTDVSGQPLRVDLTYTWNSLNNALEPAEQGKISADHIKFLRLLLSSPLSLALNVQKIDKLMSEISYIVRCATKS